MRDPEVVVTENMKKFYSFGLHLYLRAFKTPLYFLSTISSSIMNFKEWKKFNKLRTIDIL